ncbi:MAG: hypothetical protein HOI95_20370 [Chromatiales bacterium]|jgi:fumarylacetoacetase|nr:hypothetical protein [Chromatiales bacterium]
MISWIESANGRTTHFPIQNLPYGVAARRGEAARCVVAIGYNGRASTVVVSGTKIHRPLGQTKAADAVMPSFGPCAKLDIELELGAIVGTPNAMGAPVSVDQADDMLFGYVLLNDWSAREIQAWEYQPLGPFQAKAFGTTVSPWVVTRAALESFRVATPEREVALLPYLREKRPLLYDIEMEVFMRPAGAGRASRISQTNYLAIRWRRTSHMVFQ